ncbi:unnamed protein product [Rhodiola kirilowii]
MAEDDHHHEEEIEQLKDVEHKESLMENISEKLHGHDSSSDSDDGEKAASVKSKIFRLFGREKPVHQVFGGGKPAEIFLWRNKKVSGGVLGGVTAIYVLFELIGYHLLTLLCHSLILVLAVLFLWSNASSFINKSPPSIPKVIAGLWILSILGSCCNFLSLFYISFVLLFTVPVLYEKYDDKVDAFAEKAFHEIKKQYAVFDAKVLSKIPKGL